VSLPLPLQSPLLYTRLTVAQKMVPWTENKEEEEEATTQKGLAKLRMIQIPWRRSCTGITNACICETSSVDLESMGFPRSMTAKHVELGCSAPGTARSAAASSCSLHRCLNPPPCRRPLVCAEPSGTFQKRQGVSMIGCQPVSRSLLSR
jgi:hypothetical protein